MLFGWDWEGFLCGMRLVLVSVCSLDGLMRARMLGVRLKERGMDRL